MNLSRRSLLQMALVTSASSSSLPASEAETGAAPIPAERNLRSDHDLRLPAWGPYTKKYYGTSHLPSPRSGLRFDLSVCVGFYRRTPLVPNVLWESGNHPWEAAPDLSYYSARFDIEWKDRVYADVSFTEVDRDARLLTLELFNQTTIDQNLALHLLGSMNFPAGSWRVGVPEGGLWVHALDYEDLKFAKTRPTDNLCYDALLRGEVRDPLFVGGSGIGNHLNSRKARERHNGRFGDAGDSITYNVELSHAIRDAVLLLRYRTSGKGTNAFHFDGAVHGRLDFPESAQFALAEMSVGDLPAGRHAVRLRAAGGAGIDFDGFALLRRESKQQLYFEPVRYEPHPTLLPGPTDSSLILKYADASVFYGLAWASPHFVLQHAEGREIISNAANVTKPGESAHFQVRELYTSDLDQTLRFYTNNHFSTVLRGSGDGHFTDIFISPVTVPPKASRKLQALVVAGEQAAIEEQLGTFHAGESWESLRQAGRERRWSPSGNASGEKYAFSQERMAATTLSNLVYPVYFRRSYIKHNSPGRYWDSLYTWDSGFFGLGLLELDLQRALDCLNQYVTDPADQQAAFVHHGTPVPTQIYLFQEIWNRTQSRPILEYFYPRVRHMYLFLAGRYGSSTTRRLKSQLITTWDYFYNTGWDDYPAQTFVHSNDLDWSVATAGMTAYLIRSAKILRLAAAALGQRTDEDLYNSDIKIWQDALQKYAWDEASGYFGYVTHDKGGNPAGILRNENGQNFNMGLDGVLPLFAGICTRAQQGRLSEQLTSSRHLWTHIGLTSVDQSAPYYRYDGYWNGAVWMPHQWMFWRTFLDLGRPSDARRIAFTALDLWKREVELSYNCFEHFLVQSERGAGWHQFSGLSAAVLSWFSAYYRPGRLSCGMDVWINRVEVKTNQRRLYTEFRMLPSEAATATMIACLQPGASYKARVNGQPLEINSPVAGVLELSIPRTGEENFILEVFPQ